MNSISNNSKATSNREVMNDLKTLLTEGEELFKVVSNSSEEVIVAAREQFKKKLDNAKNRYNMALDETTKQIKIAAESTDNYVHENPYRLMAISGAVGVLLGVAISYHCNK